MFTAAINWIEIIIERLFSTMTNLNGFYLGAEKC